MAETRPIDGPPAVTVLLPVWNCPGYVGAAIESVLSQTYEDFEFLIIDDGSTDATPAVLARYTDPRIRHVRQENRGLAGTLNVGISLARGKFIARQDQDDLSLPERLEKQVTYMEAHPDCGLLGTWAQIMEGDRLVERFHRHPSDPSELRYQLLFNNPFVHSSVMLRKSVLDATGGYSTDPERQPPEDYELWSRIIRTAEAANLPEVLLYYREIPGSMSRMGPSPFRSRLVRICAENIAREAGADPGDPQILNIAALTHGAAELVTTKPDFRRMQKILLSAVDKLASSETRASLAADAVHRSTALRGLHLANTTLLGGLAATQGPFRSLLKRLYRILKSFSHQPPSTDSSSNCS